MANEYEEIQKLVDSVDTIKPYEYKETELAAIVDLARNVGLYEWKYEPGVTGEQDLHVGPIAQDLLKVPGLASAVHKQEDGTLTIDSKFIALAALSYCATLARILSQVEYTGSKEK